MFQLVDVVADALEVASEELANGHDDINFGGSIAHGEGCFGHFHFDESLRRGERTADASHFYAINFQRFAHNFCEARIDADGSYVGLVGIFSVELVHTLSESHHTLVGVGGFQGGELNASKEEFLNVEGVVLRHFLGNNLHDGSLHLRVVHVEVVLLQCLVDLTGVLECFVCHNMIVFS